MTKMFNQYLIYQCMPTGKQENVNVFYTKTYGEAQKKVKELKAIDNECPDRVQYLYNIEQEVMVVKHYGREYLLHEANDLPF